MMAIKELRVLKVVQVILEPKVPKEIREPTATKEPKV